MAEYDDTIKKALGLIKSGIELLGGGPLDFYLSELIKRSDLLFSRYCPYQPGDRVALVRDVECTGGWDTCGHFLVNGAKGTVHECRLDSEGKQFAFDVTFDNESWINDDGIVLPVTKKHTFKIAEDYLRRDFSRSPTTKEQE